MKFKKVFTLLALLLFVITIAACDTEKDDLSKVDEIIKEAETMTFKELAIKAIEESNGKKFYGR